MLDTVPRGVKLTEEVLPLPAKPQGLVISRNLNGTLTVTTSVRVCITQLSLRAVRLIYSLSALEYPGRSIANRQVHLGRLQWQAPRVPLDDTRSPRRLLDLPTWQRPFDVL
jgi:hypothetical protein